MTFIGFEENIAPALGGLAVDIDSLTTHPDNVREGNVDAIAASLRTFGQQKPVVVQRSTGYIVAGNHTFLAAKKLGWSQIAASLVDMDDQTALSYLLADNRSADLATYRREQLAKRLQALADEGALAATLWSADDLDDLYAATEEALTPFEEFKGGYAMSDEEIAERQAKATESRPTAKMKELTVVLSVEEHATFLRRLALLEKLWGTSGKIATLFEAVARAANPFEADSVA